MIFKTKTKLHGAKNYDSFKYWGIYVLVFCKEGELNMLARLVDLIAQKDYKTLDMPRWRNW